MPGKLRNNLLQVSVLDIHSYAQCQMPGDGWQKGTIANSPAPGSPMLKGLNRAPALRLHQGNHQGGIHSARIKKRPGERGHHLLADGLEQKFPQPLPASASPPPKRMRGGGLSVFGPTK